MTATLGRFLILASVFVSAAGAMVAFAAGKKQSLVGLKMARRFAYAFAALMILATGVTWLTRGQHVDYMPFAIGTWLSCAAFFAFLIAGPANPFLSVPNPPLDGNGPNPLLQNHVLMVAHPP